MATQLKFRCTNNIAETKACITGLNVALDVNIKDLEVFGNSILILTTPWGNGKFESHCSLNTEDVGLIEWIFIFHLLKLTMNQFADALAILVSNAKMFDGIKLCLINVDVETSNLLSQCRDRTRW